MLSYSYSLNSGVSQKSAKPRVFSCKQSDHLIGDKYKTAYLFLEVFALSPVGT